MELFDRGSTNDGFQRDRMFDRITGIEQLDPPLNRSPRAHRL
jgi:hypothetical protein